MTEKFHIEFEPKEDITTFELAKCLKFYALVLGHRNQKADAYQFWFQQLPPNIQRHFNTYIE